MRASHPSIGTLWLRRLVGLGVLLLPAALLFWAADTVAAPARNLLWMGVLLQAIVTLLALFSRANYTEPAAWPVIMLYAVAFSWLQFAGAGVAPHVRQV